jgi:hypothetical protein
MMIQPKYLTLNQLLNGRLFQIPRYQRAYSWDRKQREDLFSDIEHLRTTGGDAVHFMATMVGLSKGKKTIATNEFHDIEVVDGQQRLTTLIILFKSLSESLDKAEKNARLLRDEIEALLIKNNENTTLLKTEHDTKRYFKAFLEKGEYPLATQAETLADRRLLEAMEDCKNFIVQWKGSKLELGIILKNRLALIFHELEDEAAVYTVFEVLNSRGLDVAWLDRLKSVLMGAAFETSKGDKEAVVQDLHGIWGNIYRCLGLHSGMSSESLRFAATLKSEAKLNKVQGQEAAIETLRGLAGDSAKGTIDVSNWILKVVNAMDKLMAGKRRSAVTRVVQARLLAVAIELSDMSDPQRDGLLDAWEKVTFRIYGMCRKDGRTRVGEYVRLARKLVFEGMEYEDALKEIHSLGAGDFAIGPAIEQLRDENCYEGWEEELRYFMYRYEEHLTREQGRNFKNEHWEHIWEETAAKSIEHIHPQSKPRKDVHRLGNLVMLPPKLNSQLGNKKPQEKAEDYGDTGLLIAAELKSTLLKEQWTSASVKKREEHLLKWAKREWAD